MLTVYLAGSISSGAEHLNWRDLAAGVLKDAGITVLSPLRFQSPDNFTHGGLHDATVPDGFMVKVDLADVRKADAILLVYWKGFGRQSVGTWAEFGVAMELGTPVVVVTDDPNVADHPFIRCGAAAITNTVEEGLEWIIKMLPC